MWGWEFCGGRQWGSLGTVRWETVWGWNSWVVDIVGGGTVFWKTVLGVVQMGWRQCERWYIWGGYSVVGGTVGWETFWGLLQFGGRHCGRWDSWVGDARSEELSRPV